jgi:phosphoesterase RecJ-like protein
MNSEEILILKQALSNKSNIVIVGHKNPDGDAIGSCLGLANFLKQLEHQVTVVMPNDFPEFLKWIPETQTIINYDQHRDNVKNCLSEANLVFTLDFNALNRTGDLAPELMATNADFILIDHHQEPDDYALVTYSDVGMSSTSEMVYHFIEFMGGLNLLNKEIATQLYVGIMTDTGSFRFPATTAATHRIIAHLIEAGAPNSIIHQNVYDTNSPDRLKLLGVALNNMVMLPEYKTAYITMSQEELNNNNFKKGDTEGFVNYALSMKGVIFAMIFIENKKEKIIKISLRSKGSFSVNDFSRKYFNGGGHTNAAGGKSSKTLSKTVEEFISILPGYKKELNEA